MTNYVVRFILFWSTLFSAALLLIRTQAYDDYALRQLLPANCAAACFMGIQPGITADDEALKLLTAHPWVDPNSVRLIPLPPSSSRFDDLAHIQWDWDAHRPDLLTINSRLPDGNINIRNHRVESIAFDTTITAAAIYHAWGNPSVLVFAPIRSREPWSIEWVYPDASIQFNLQMQVRACPYLANLWLQPLHIQMSLRTDAQLSTTAETSPQINLRNVLHARKRRMCGLS